LQQVSFQACGCLPWTFPNFGVVWGEETVCGAAGIRCLSEKSSEEAITLAIHFASSLAAILTSLKANAQDGSEFGSGASCVCPIECAESNYVPQLSLVPIRNDAQAAQVRELRARIGTLMALSQVLLEKNPWFSNQEAKIIEFEEQKTAIQRKLRNKYSDDDVRNYTGNAEYDKLIKRFNKLGTKRSKGD